MPTVNAASLWSRLEPLLARVQKRYLALLHEAGMADPFEARLAALEEGIRRHDGDVWLVAVRVRERR